MSTTPEAPLIHPFQSAVGPVAGAPVPGGAIPGPHEPLDYVGIVRGPGRAWWRSLLALLIFAPLVIFFFVILLVLTSVFGVLTGQTWDWWITETMSESLGPAGLLINNLFLVLLIPATVLSTWICQRIRIGFTHSVAGRWRWGWFGWVTLALLPLYVVYIGLSFVLDVPTEITPHPQMVAMLIIVLLTTPLQAAGEEYAFRGWLLQNIGGLFANRVVAWVVPTLLSAALFAVIHTSLDPWVLADLAVFAIAAAILTWRTGGLEAAVSLHAVHNVMLMCTLLVVGGFDNAIVSPETTSTPLALTLTTVSKGAAVAIVWWLAKRRGVQQFTTGPTRRQKPIPVYADASARAD